MTYLDTPEQSPLFSSDMARLGYVANYTKVFALRPEAYAAWQQLAGEIKRGMDERLYELVTIAAAKQLGSQYCLAAHARALGGRFYDDATVRKIVADHRSAGLDPLDVTIMDFAERAATAPDAIRQKDVTALRATGLSDVEIMQVVLAVAARRFFTSVLHATGTEPDGALTTWL